MTQARSATRRASVFILLLGLAGCGGDGAPAPASAAASASPMCQARPDDTTPGCFASPSSMLCSPGGCQSLCAGGQTPVVCAGAQAMGAQAMESIPAPASDAGCTVVAIPTPANELFYCCPCGSP